MVTMAAKLIKQRDRGVYNGNQRVLDKSAVRAYDGNYH